MTLPFTLDEGWATIAEAEHATLDRVAALGPGVVACTHVGGGRVTVTVSDAGQRRDDGRAFAYPGLALLTGELTAAEIADRSAVELVLLLGGAVAGPDAVVDTLGFVRPRWRAGRLELLTRPAAGGRLVPFEQRDQIPCCSDHA